MTWCHDDDNEDAADHLINRSNYLVLHKMPCSDSVHIQQKRNSQRFSQSKSGSIPIPSHKRQVSKFLS